MALLAPSSSMLQRKLGLPAQGAKAVSVPRFAGPRRASAVVPKAQEQQASVTGLVFDPVNAAKNELTAVDKAPATVSLGRMGFDPECEAAINEQINVEYNVSYVYHALHCYFDRDNVGLPGFAKFFKNASDEERDHAHLLMNYQNKRGGRVQFKSISMPQMEFNHEKGDALFSMELALSLEKLNFQKLRELHEVADKCGDAPMSDFIEGDLLADQVDSIKSAAEMVATLRRVGNGVGVHLIDRELQAA